MGVIDAMKYLSLSPNSEQTVEKQPTSSTIAIRDTHIYVIAANITWKDHKMQPLAQEYQEILPQAKLLGPHGLGGGAKKCPVALSSDSEQTVEKRPPQTTTCDTYISRNATIRT